MACRFTDGLVAEFERNAAENERSEHEKDRNIKGRHQNRVGEWEGCKQAAAAKNKPGLIAVPDGLDCGRHQIAFFVRLRKCRQNTNAKVGPVQKDIEHNRGGDEKRPDKWVIHGSGLLCLFCDGCKRRAGRAVFANRWIGRVIVKAACRDAGHVDDACRENDRIDHHEYDQ